jgi:hypothetical protein
MSDYDRLIELQKQFPKLTFDNNGYEYADLSDNTKQVEEISEICSRHIEGFIRFNNFKPRKDGTFDVRCRYRWDSSFRGVGYFPFEYFKED